MEDLVAAELEIVQFSQRRHFGEEIEILQKDKQLSPRNRLSRLDPILQNGTLRVGGRLHKSAMPEDAKHPAILSKNSKVSTLIMRHTSKGRPLWAQLCFGAAEMQILDTTGQCSSPKDNQQMYYMPQDKWKDWGAKDGRSTRGSSPAR